MRILSATFIGGGIGFPTAITIFNNSYTTVAKVPEALRDPDSKFEIQWMGKGIHNEVGQLIDGLGKIINSNSLNRESIITGIQLTTSGQFDKNICKQVGFNSERLKRDGGVGCFTGIK